MLRQKLDRSRRSRTVPETPFYIPATGSSTRPRRTLKHGDCFAVLDSHADIGASAGGPDGIFFCDTRYLSHLEMLLNGKQPLLLGSKRARRQLAADRRSDQSRHLSRSETRAAKGHAARRATLFLWRGTAYQRLRIQNHGDRPFEVRLTLAFASDFADLFEVRGHAPRAPRHRHRARLSGATEVVAELRGPRRQSAADDAAVRARAGTPHHQHGVLRFELAAQRIPLDLCDGEMRPRRRAQAAQLPFRKGLRAAFQEHRTASRGMATITTSNTIFNEVLCRSMADLAMLTTETPQGPYPYAGIPWYSTTFGRDGIITALQMLWCDPAIAQGVLRRLAAYQAKDFDPLADARARKDPARDARRRDGGAAGGSVRALLRQRRCDAAVRDAGGSLYRAHRRHRDAAGTMAQHRSGAGLDRRPGRSRSRRFRRVSPRRRAGLGQSGLEGLPRRHLPRRRFDCGRPDRALRGAGLRLCGEAPGGRGARAGSASMRSATHSMHKR